MKEEKTNVMRVLEQKKIPYKAHFYADTEAVAGLEICAVLGEDPAQTFKTLVTVGKSGTNYVFVVPVDSDLDLKKAAEAVSEKNIEMIKNKELLPLTGYIHGGCSPIGMKKFFRTVIDDSALLFDTIYFSGGKIGYQVEVDPKNIEKAIKVEFKNIAGGKMK